MSKILDQIKEAKSSNLGKSSFDEKFEAGVLESLNIFQDKVDSLCSCLRSLSDTLGDGLLFK